MNLPLNLDLSHTQTQWSAILNPIIKNPLIDGRMVTISLTSGATAINHGLSRNQQGWILVDQNAAASIYRSQPFNSETMTLTSNATVTVTLWVF